VREGIATDLLESLRSNLAHGSGLQNLRGDVGACTDLALRNAFADFIEDRVVVAGSNMRSPRWESAILAGFAGL
jgi:hypothetical protein